MKKILTITLLVLLTAGLFVSCNADAVSSIYTQKEREPFCFTALKADSIVCLKSYVNSHPLNTEKLADVNFLYSRDNSTWADYTTGTSITLENENDKVYFKAKEKISGLNGQNVYYYFTGNGKVSVEGNIMYLLNPSGESVEMADHAFASLFIGNTALVSAKDLLLPATKLAISCYHSMFQGCSSLAIAPELPATTLAGNCYEAMFLDCESLTTAPVLPANTLANNCYQYMFKNCSALNSVTMLATNVNASINLNEWVYGVAASGTFHKASGTTFTAGDGVIPNGWTVRDYEPAN